MHNSQSDAPPPSLRPREPHEMRSDCAVTFAALHSTLKEMKSEMGGIHTELKEYNRSQGELEGSVKGLWREVRDELRPELRAMSRDGAASRQAFTKDLAASQQAFTKDLAASQQAFTKDINDRLEAHVKECPSRRKAMKRAESDSSDTIDRPLDVPFREDSQVVNLPPPGGDPSNPQIPKAILWVGGLIGAAVAASGYVIHLFLNS